MRAIFCKDVRLQFVSFKTYFFMAAFTICIGVDCASSFLFGIGTDDGTLFPSMTGALLFVFPILTMNSFVDEHNAGTYTLLTGSPVSSLEIVQGKMAACMTVFTMTVLIAFLTPFIVLLVSGGAVLRLLSAALGIWLLGGCFIALGIFISSMVERSFHSWLFTAAAICVFRLISMIIPFTSEGLMKGIISTLGVFNSFASFEMGIVSLSNVVYLISFALFCVFMTCKVIEKRKWGRGDEI